MNVFNRLEGEDGHKLTLLGNPVPGASLYYCEVCGALVIIDGQDIRMFHPTPGSESSIEICFAPEAIHTLPIPEERLLSTKLKKLRDDDYELMKKDMGDD